MKQKKQIKKEKDNYLKRTFLFPVVTSIIGAVIMGMALSVSSLTTASNTEMATLLMQAAMIMITFSPTILLLNSVLSYRHMKKHPNGSNFYVKTPMLCSLLVWGVQVLYLVTLTGA